MSCTIWEEWYEFYIRKPRSDPLERKIRNVETYCVELCELFLIHFGKKNLMILIFKNINVPFLKFLYKKEMNIFLSNVKEKIKIITKRKHSKNP